MSQSGTMLSLLLAVYRVVPGLTVQPAHWLRTDRVVCLERKNTRFDRSLIWVSTASLRGVVHIEAWCVHGLISAICVVCSHRDTASVPGAVAMQRLAPLVNVNVCCAAVCCGR